MAIRRQVRVDQGGSDPVAGAGRMKSRAPIRSKWVGGPPSWTPAPERPTAACARALMQSMMDSLRRGHHKVAARRFLMLRACRATVPEAARLACESTIARLSAGERARMSDAAQRWAALLGHSWS
jgi:hypothetical protein